MGLLDDAIREHLELKRRRGADPGEVAREQHEALSPVDRAAAVEDEPALDHARVARSSGEPIDPPVAGAIAERVPDDLPVDLDDAPLAPDGSAVPAEGAREVVAAPGETAELDMRTVLGDDPPAEYAPGGQEASPAGDLLEWEMPGNEAEVEPEEDVLEETPDFLRDTPEQERLWFEQRPPRDFDFDE
jgi:hypothetical protein